jgi:hypothetical protein
MAPCGGPPYSRVQASRRAKNARSAALPASPRARAQAPAEGGDALAKARNIRLAGFESLAVYAALRAARARAPAGAAVAAVGLTVHGAPSLWTKRWRAWW